MSRGSSSSRGTNLYEKVIAARSEHFSDEEGVNGEGGVLLEEGHLAPHQRQREKGQHNATRLVHFGGNDTLPVELCTYTVEVTYCITNNKNR